MAMIDAAIADWEDDDQVLSDNDGTVYEDSSIDKLSKTLNKFASSVKVPTKKKRGRPTNISNSKADRDDEENGENLKGVLDCILKEIVQMKKEFQKSNDRFGEVLSKIKELQKENIALGKKVADRDRKIDELETRIDTIEQRSRANEIIVSGSVVPSGEERNLKSFMVELLSTSLRIHQATLQKYEYKKIGRGTSTVAVLLPSEQDKASLFTAARTLRPQNLFINESLIPSKRKLFYELRKFKRETHTAGGRTFHSVFSLRGEIYIKKNENDRDIHVIRKLSELNGIMGS